MYRKRKRKPKGEGKQKKVPSTAIKPPWLELPDGIWANILHRLGAIVVLLTAQEVCRSWRRICKHPSMWRVIDMWNDLVDLLNVPYDLEVMCENAVDRSQGELVDINLESFANDRLLKYIAERSVKLEKLSIAHCYREVRKCWDEVAQKLPLLEELSLTHTVIVPKGIEALGRFCPKLKLFKLNKSFIWDLYTVSDIDDGKNNEEALAIAKNLSALHHLQLIGNSMTNRGLEAILNGCPHLVSLDLRQCHNVSLNEDLSSRISRQIKDMKHPDDSLDDFEFSFESDDLEFTFESEDASDASYVISVMITLISERSNRCSVLALGSFMKLLAVFCLERFFRCH